MRERSQSVSRVRCLASDFILLPDLLYTCLDNHMTRIFSARARAVKYWYEGHPLPRELLIEPRR